MDTWGYGSYFTGTRSQKMLTCKNVQKLKQEQVLRMTKDNKV